MNLSVLAPRKARFFPGLLFLVIGVLSVDAFAQSDANRRLNRLENEIQTLSRAVFRGEQPPAGSISGGGSAAANAQVEVRLQQLEQELRDLRGKVEKNAFEARSLRNDMERFKGDLELRMQDLGAGNSGATVQSGSAVNKSAMGYTTRNSAVTGGGVDDVVVREPSQAANSGEGFTWDSNNNKGNLGSYTQSVDGSVSGAADQAATMYEAAFSLLKKKQYDESQSAFEGFLNAYPDHVLVGNAKYWLGETHYVRGNFENAARLFAQGYQEFPKGSKAADNLLKLGMALAALGKKEDACIALSQISAAGFVGVDEVLRRAGQEKSRIGC
ncbi:MAG: tol-pal system protein YbgF [Alphaproteobacteria bacterium]